MDVEFKKKKTCGAESEVRCLIALVKEERGLRRMYGTWCLTKMTLIYLNIIINYFSSLLYKKTQVLNCYFVDRESWTENLLLNQSYNFEVLVGEVKLTVSDTLPSNLTTSPENIVLCNWLENFRLNVVKFHILKNKLVCFVVAV